MFFRPQILYRFLSVQAPIVTIVNIVDLIDYRQFYPTKKSDITLVHVYLQGVGTETLSIEPRYLLSFGIQRYQWLSRKQRCLNQILFL